MGIVVLDGELVSRIAAGEVVERPSSVQKELIENALDAGARRISVSIEEGGVSLIEVADDGEGMNRQDAKLCLERHATSKLKEYSDLEEIASYGFRGEALPSIASVSRLSIRTRHGDEEEGLLLLAEGTLRPKVKVTASPKGTVVSVRDLFFNVPARRKFLRSTNTESGHVGEVFVDAALSRPDVAFSLKRDGRQVRNFPRVSSSRERAEQVLGETELIHCVGERGPLSVEAFLCLPERARRGASGLKILINGRPVRDRALASSIAHAYGAALERGRYPRGVVYLTLPGRLVDVNVHPQKTEVRFASARAVLDALHSVISRKVAEQVSLVASRSAGEVQSSGPAHPTAQKAQVLRDGPRPISGERYSVRGRKRPTSAATATAAAPALQRQQEPRKGRWFAEAQEVPQTQGAQVSKESLQKGASWRGLRFIGQAGPGYLLCESREGLSILDQHAADEVRLRARLQSALKKGALPGQALLFPAVFELSQKAAEILPQREQALSRLGLDVRARSVTSVSMHSLPRLLLSLEPEIIFRVVQDSLLLSKLGEEEAVEATLSDLSCRAAIGSGDSISRADAETLLRDLKESDFNLSCRHGHPLLHSVSFAELSRKRGQR